MRYFITIVLMFFSTIASAEWHHGKLGIIAIGYDGETISIGQDGFTKSDCTCYPAWPSRYCLDPNRSTFEQEYAFLLSIKARDKSVSINIDETTCKIKSMYEQ